MKYTSGSRSFPLSKMKDFEKSMKKNKTKIIEFSLRKVKKRTGLQVDPSKVKELDYGNFEN
jgi:hypothetical protein